MHIVPFLRGPFDTYDHTVDRELTLRARDQLVSKTDDWISSGATAPIPKAERENGFISAGDD